MQTPSQLAATRKAWTTRIHGAGSAEVLAADAELREVKCGAAIEGLVWSAPPLDAAARERLAALLRREPDLECERPMRQ